MGCTVANMYREIAQVFHQNGADRVVLLSSKNSSGLDYEMTIEIAVDGSIQLKKLRLECENRWPSVQITIIDLNDEKNRLLVDEVMEDGILL